MRRRQAHALANGLLPFAVASQMCSFLAERLQREAVYEQFLATQKVLDRQMDRVSSELASEAFWEDIGIDADETTRRRFLDRVTAALSESLLPHDADTVHPPDAVHRATTGRPDVGEVIHRISEGDRQTLLGWIERARGDVPYSFCQVIGQLEAQEEELERIDRELVLVPAEEALRPLIEVHQRSNQELGALIKERDDLAERVERVSQTLELMSQRRERLREQIVTEQQHDMRVRLTDRTQAALQEFAQALTRRKAVLLGERLVARFNDLCRKQDLVQAVQIDPDSFSITLWRLGRAYDRRQLSAGERQLLAVATMWALREVSGVPMPVILDTPLGRLDTDHRQTLIHKHLPRAGHQVILLATDSEVGEQELAHLEPVVSRVYSLEYDATRGETCVTLGLDARDAAPLEIEADKWI
jgi:DNA sulfur modification protein DndD